MQGSKPEKSAAKHHGTLRHFFHFCFLQSGNFELFVSGSPNRVAGDPFGEEFHVPVTSRKSRQGVAEKEEGIGLLLVKQTGDAVPCFNALFHVKGHLHLFQHLIQFRVSVTDVVAPLVGDLGGVPHLIEVGIKRT